jgi:hypothetical protein
MEPHSRFGRRQATDDRHLRRFSLTPATMPDKPTPVVVGTWWTTAMDMTRQIRHKGRLVYVTATDPNNLGGMLGGHAYCLKPKGVDDPVGWWRFYWQHRGSCTGHSSARALSLMNRMRYDAEWIYEQAQAIDEWDDTPPEEGSSVRAAMDVLRDLGAKRIFRGKTGEADLVHGIAANRWATTIEDVIACLGYPPGTELLPILNSWGPDGYPHITYIPAETMSRLLFEMDGEATIITDR